MVQVEEKSIRVRFYPISFLLLFLLLNACGGGGGGPSFGPQVVKTDPGNQAGDVPVDAAIQATFSYDMDPATVNKETFIIVGGVEGKVSYRDRTAVFTPTGAGLEKGKQYNAILTTGVKDLDGIPLPSNFIWSFVTAGPPTIETFAPSDKGVPAETLITVTFSKSMDVATLNSQTFFLKKEGSTAAVGAAIAYNDQTRTATLDPISSLEFSKKYNVTVTKGVKDLAGNLLEADKVWSFETASQADTTPPAVVSKTPPPDAVGIVTNTDITVTFNKKVDLPSLQSNFFLSDPNGATVPTTLDYPAPSLTATLHPNASLNFGTTYHVVLRRGIKDGSGSGNATASDGDWSFTTGNAPDTTPPTVATKSPGENETAISVKRAIQATFSESMKKGTVEEPRNFIVTENGAGRIDGVVTYHDETHEAVFTPVGRLKYNTTYFVVLTSGMVDQANNPLIGAFWQFNTVVSPPTVIEKSPLENEGNVGTDRKVGAKFSALMNTATINPESFHLVQVSPTPGTVAGTLQFADANQIAIFTPDLALQAGAVYRVTLTDAIEDQNGNPLGSSVSWTFTTTSPAQGDVTPPQVVSTDPADGGVATNGTVQVVFDEAINPATVNAQTFRVGISGQGDEAQGQYAVNAATAIFTPDQPLLSGATYQVTVTTGAADLAGNSLERPREFSFTAP